MPPVTHRLGTTFGVTLALEGGVTVGLLRRRLDLGLPFASFSA